MWNIYWLEISKNCIWFEKGFLQNIFEDCVLILIYCFCVKKEFWSKKVFGKKFYTDKLKESFLLSILGLEVETVYKKDFKRFYWSFLFLHKHGVAQNLFKKRNFIIWPIGFHIEKIGWAFKRKNGVFCEYDWSCSTLAKS